MNINITNKYEENSKIYKSIWLKKRKLLIVLFFIFLIPGIFYYLFSYSSPKSRKQRNDLANDVLKISLSETLNGINSFDSNIDLNFVNSYAKIGLYRSVSDFSKDSENICKSIYEQLEKDNLLEAFSSVMNASYHSNTISRKAIINCNATIKLKVNLKEFYGYSFSYYVIEVRREKTKDGYKNSTYTYNIFTGTYITSDFYEINYEGSIFIEDKSLKIKAHNKYSNMRKPNYEIVTKEFTDNFNIAVQKDDGVALNYLFQPRIVAQLLDFKKQTNPFAISNIENSITFLFRTERAKKDLAFNIEKINKFFKNKETAFNMLEKENAYLKNIYDIIFYLDDNSFIKKIGT